MLEKLQQIPFWQKLLAVVGILLIIGFIYYNYVYKEKEKDIARLERDLNSLIVENTEARKMENELPNLERKIQELEFNLNYLTEILPTETEVESFLNDLYRMALRNNLRVPNWLKQPEAGYQEFLMMIPMKVDATGSYHDLRRFFENLSQTTRIVNILNLDLKIEQRRGGPGQIVAKFDLTTFRFKDDESEM